MAAATREEEDPLATLAGAARGWAAKKSRIDCGRMVGRGAAARAVERAPVWPRAGAELVARTSAVASGAGGVAMRANSCVMVGDLRARADAALQLDAPPLLDAPDWSHP